MDGRWAQLAVDAHIAHAIDFTKPVKRFAEKAVFDILEIKRLTAALTLLNILTEKEGMGKLKNMVIDSILPWYGLNNIVASSTSSNPFDPERLRKLQEYNKQLNRQ